MLSFKSFVVFSLLLPALSFYYSWVQFSPKWLKSAVVKLAIATKVSLTKNPAIQDFLNNAQVGTKIEHVLGEFVRWIVLLFPIAASNLLGLSAISALLGGIFTIILTLSRSGYSCSWYCFSRLPRKSCQRLSGI